MLTALNCELEERRSELVFDLAWDKRPPREGNRTGRCRLRFDIPDFKLEGELRIDRDFFRRFLSQARRMYRELDGSAKLDDWDSPSEVELKVVNRGRGIIAIGAKLCQYVATARGLPPAAELPFGQEVMLTVGGLTIDQSYLPPFLDDLRDFLAEADADLDQAAIAGADTSSGARPNYLVLFGGTDCPAPKALTLFLEGARKHGVPLGDRALLFTTSRLASAAMKRLPGMPRHIRKGGVTFARSAVEWQRLPEVFGLLAGRPSQGCTGIVTGNRDFGAAETAEVARILRRRDWFSEMVLVVQGAAKDRYAWLRRLAAVGQAAILLDHSGTVLSIALHPADERMLQQLANAACDVGLWVAVRTDVEPRRPYPPP